MKPSGGSPTGRDGSEGNSLAAAGMTFAVVVVGGVLLGVWADRKWGTMPLFTLLGMVVSCLWVGFWTWTRLKRDEGGNDE